MVQLSPSFAIHTLGCKVNTYESDAIAARLKEAGFIERSFEEPADVYIVNTCTVTNIADRKSRQMLRRARKRNVAALVVAAGCYVDDAARNGSLEELIRERVIDLAVSNKDKAGIAALITEKLRGPELLDSAPCAQADPKAGTDGRDAFVTELDGHTRAFIKVQDGCNMYCSYCIIPYVRGPLRARPAEDVAREVRGLAEKGTAEVVITGIHLSSLGEGLLEILKETDRIPGIRRIRLGSLEPTLITEHFAAELGKIEKLCPHFHLSLQSGDNEILRRMNRHYTTERFAESCRILREHYDRPAITTDLIVGFPGETAEQFRNTCRFAEQIGFYEAHVFPYSRRKGTPADRMDGQLTEAEKAARSEVLIGLARRMSEQFRQACLGKELEFLSEELITVDGVSYETGYTPEYIRCVRRSDSLHKNAVLRGKASMICQEKVIDGALLLE